jgi:hypothetical protein
MTDSSTENQADNAEDGAGITDDQLPEDLQPSEDNPLAQPLDDEEALDDLDVRGGRPAEQWDDEELED